MTKTIIVETGVAGNSNNKVLIEGIKIPDRKIPVLLDFDKSKPIAYCNVFKEEKLLKARINILENIDGYPAIGFKVLSHKVEDDIIIFTEIEIFCVSINQNPNVDSSIKKISEQ